MIYNLCISDCFSVRKDMLDLLKNRKLENSTYKIIDIGGTTGGWSKDVIDALVDINSPNVLDSNIKFFNFDITDPNGWNTILDYVDNNGKYDFCICSHTLEDIINPAYVCQQISKIAKEGFIAFPSKYRELARDNSPYRGYIHHRWIFTVVNNELIGYPKVPFIEYETFLDSIASCDKNINDLSFYWKDKIEIKYVNNNYLGPDENSVINYYRNLCIKDDCDTYLTASSAA